MKAQTAKDFAKHLEETARHYQAGIYRVSNDFNPFTDAKQIACELRQIAQDMGEKETDY